MFDPITFTTRLQWAWWQSRCSHGISVRLDGETHLWVPYIDNENLSDDLPEAKGYRSPEAALWVAYSAARSISFLNGN